MLIIIRVYKNTLTFVSIMLKAYKYRIYPNIKQKEQLNNFFGGVRFVYNLGLETKIAAWTSAKKVYTCIDLAYQMKELKDTEATWLQECPSQALQMSLRNLDNAYTKFSKGGGFPKFKNKHNKQSIQFPQQFWVDFNNGKIKIPKLGLVDCIFHRQFKGKVKTATVTKTKTNKYFVSILVDNSTELPIKKPILAETTVGIDLGIKTMAVLSDGTEFVNPKWLAKARKNLVRQQRSLSRKVKGSKHYEKQRLVVANLHEHITNQRQDYLHKVSTAIVKQYDTIVLEDLSIQNMMKSHKLALAIGDVGWFKFKQYLTYKAEWYGKNILTIGRFEPSSKICSNCGAINKELTLADRIWTCNMCETTHDRDHNAAINIKNFGLRLKPLNVNVIQ